jgi:hypothetical protein
VRAEEELMGVEDFEAEPDEPLDAVFVAEDEPHPATPSTQTRAAPDAARRIRTGRGKAGVRMGQAKPRLLGERWECDVSIRSVGSRLDS